MAVKALEYLKTQPNSGPTSWTNGPYTYDGSGNIAGIGPEAYIYDKVGRLQGATVRGPDMVSTQTQSFTYDEYGNLTSTTKLGQTVPLGLVPGTNQLSGITYDSAGNVVTVDALHYEYDSLGMLSTIKVGASTQPRMIYAYTADDERLFAFDVGTNTTHWTVRGFDNKVLRDFKQQGSSWSLERDYVYRDGLLLAALKSAGGVEHYSLDHLGTPRLVTDGNAQKIGYHAYWPFGEEWSPGNAQENSPLKFTGHERDVDPSGGSMSLDYMHARMYAGRWGRFLSVDPTWSSTDISRPQTWNRYSYVLNNPVFTTDPDGRCSLAIADCVLEAAGSAGLVVLTAITAIEFAKSDVGKVVARHTGKFLLDLGHSDGAMSSGERFAMDTIHRAEKVQEEAAKGTAGGERAGKSFTPKGKQEIHDQNAGKNGGENRCENCDQKVVPGQKSLKGVSRPQNERQADHIIPKSKGGDGSPSNGQTLCAECNGDKSDKMPPPQ